MRYSLLYCSAEHKGRINFFFGCLFSVIYYGLGGNNFVKSFEISPPVISREILSKSPKTIGIIILNCRRIVKLETSISHFELDCRYDFCA